MTNTERFTQLAQIGHESAQCAFGQDPDGLPPAEVVWSFLQCNCGEGDIITDPALDLYMQDDAPRTMPVEFGCAYDALVAEVVA